MTEATSTVMKGGETCIQTLLSRRSRRHGDPADWRGGLLVTVKTLPRVEEFMQSLGGGEVVDVQTVGRYWQGMTPGQRLDAYVISALSKQQSDDGSTISLERLGNPLLLPDAEGKDRFPVVNLSFLRLRGISDGNGVTFGIRGVYSLDELRRIRDKITVGCRRFYIDYIRPADLLGTVFTVEISSQEVQL